MEDTPFSTENSTANFTHGLETEAFKKYCINQFYQFFELPSDGSKSLNIGYTFLFDSPPFIAFFMQNWVSYIDEKLRKIEESTEEYADTFGFRGFTLEEFKLVVSGKIGEEYYGRHKVFDYLFLMDIAECEYFTILNEEDEKETLDKYVRAIQQVIKSEIWVLRFFFTKRVPLYYRISSFKLGSYLVSQSGTGKSEWLKFLFYNLQLRSQRFKNRTLILLEPAGDLSLEIAALALNNSTHRKRVVYLNPFIRETAQELFGYDLLGADYTFTINPFQLPKNATNKDINYLTEELSDAFFQIVKNETTSQMDVLIEACVETLLRKENADITDLKKFMNEAENEELLNLMEQIPNEERSKMAERIRNDKKLKTSLGGVFYRLQRILGNSEFRRLLKGNSTVNLEKAMNEGKVIIFDAAKSKLGKYASPAFGKLMLSLILGYAKKRQGKTKERRKETICFVDEFHNYAVGSIHEIMEESRKFSLHMVLSHQFVSQGMDNEMRRSITSNSILKVAGDNDSDSLKFMSENMGDLTPKDFNKLPKYSFYIHDKKNKKAGVQTVRVPDFLIKHEPPFYQSKSELKQFFLWMANESGYYKKLPPTIKTLPPPSPKGSGPAKESSQKVPIVYNPKFED